MREKVFQLGTVHLLRKGKRVGSWSAKTLIFPYEGGYIVQDHPYVSISFQDLCQKTRQQVVLTKHFVLFDNIFHLANWIKTHNHTFLLSEAKFMLIFVNIIFQKSSLQELIKCLFLSIA